MVHRFGQGRSASRFASSSKRPDAYRQVSQSNAGLWLDSPRWPELNHNLKRTSSRLSIRAPYFLSHVNSTRHRRFRGSDLQGTVSRMTLRPEGSLMLRLIFIRRCQQCEIAGLVTCECRSYNLASHIAGTNIHVVRLVKLRRAQPCATQHGVRRHLCFNRDRSSEHRLRTRLGKHLVVRVI
jgi:hypothetical protein